MARIWQLITMTGFVKQRHLLVKLLGEILNFVLRLHSAVLYSCSLI